VLETAESRLISPEVGAQLDDATTEQTRPASQKMAVVPKSVNRARNQRGFTLIDLLFVIGLLGVVSTLAIPGLTRARGSAQASSALGTLRVINSAQLSFAIGCGLGFYAPDLPALGAAPPASSEGFVTSDLSSAITVIRSGYSFTLGGTPLAGSPASCNGLAAGQTTPAYVAVADPLDPGTVPRFFGTNADGAIYEHAATLNGVMPETGQPAAGVPVQR
jgi:type II secretory pathway pseudopilin PulG